MRRVLATGSGIRRLWDLGCDLKRRHGAANVADMTLGNPSADPPDALLRALEDVVAHPPPEIHRYPPNAGLPETRERIAEHLVRHGVLPGARAEHVVVTCGASAATNLVLRSVLDPGEEVILLAPYFPDYPFHVSNHAGKVVSVRTTEDFLPDLAAIDRGVTARTRVVIVNHPNNPSGRQYPEPLLRDIVALLRDRSRKHGRPIYLISDEPYREVRFTAEPFVSPMSLYEHGIMAYSFSKSHSIPGQRIGYLVIHPECPDAGELVAACSVANRIMGFVNASTIWQYVIGRCLDSTVDLAQLRRHRERLLAALTERGYQTTPTQGTFYLFPRTPGGDDEAFVQRAAKDLLLLVPGGTFGFPGHFRMAFCVDDRTVDLAVERLPRVDSAG
jgi:aspartate aminotransferase